ncbi:MAG: signal peptidase II [Candidatus Omnitrophica bacterium]|nr:signal peptidase II [Candidatus Omnitrophota bacterium]
MNTQARRPRMWFLPLVAVLVLCLDQASKAVVLYFLSDHQSVPVIPQIFYLTLVRNTGIAFGFFHGGSPLLFAAIVVGILVLSLLAFSMRSESFSRRLALGFILGGAVGNLTDRLTRGAVVDFLDFRIWPVFNVADSLITVGVGILIITIFKKSQKSDTKVTATF